MNRLVFFAALLNFSSVLLLLSKLVGNVLLASNWESENIDEIHESDEAKMLNIKSLYCLRLMSKSINLGLNDHFLLCFFFFWNYLKKE